MKRSVNSPHLGTLSPKKERRFNERSPLSKSFSIKNGYNGDKKGRWGPYPDPQRRHCLPLKKPDNKFHFPTPSPSLSHSVSRSQTGSGSPPPANPQLATDTQSVPLPSPPLDGEIAKPIEVVSKLTRKLTLERILRDQIHWVPASKLTFETETNSQPEMAPLTRAQSKKEATPQEKRRLALRDAGARVSKDWPSLARNKRPKGMSNPGNYCYRRSIMQALVNTPQLLNWISTHNSDTLPRCPECFVRRPCAACSLKEVMQSYFGSSQHSLSSAINRFDRLFVNNLWPQLGQGMSARQRKHLAGSQQDAQEFLQFIGSSLRRMNLGSMNTQPIPLMLYNALFTVMSRHTWTCPKCKQVHPSRPQTEFGQYITTDSPALHLSVQQYIDHEYYGDTVKDLTCDACQAKGLKAKRNAELLAVPDVLFIGLRCFDWSSGMSRKRYSDVTLSPTLDLTQHQPKRQRTEEALKYELKHVIYHAGSSPKSGHYYGVFTTPGGVFGCNDSVVTAGASLTRKSGGRGTMPYVLVYSRVD